LPDRCEEKQSPVIASGRQGSWLALLGGNKEEGLLRYSRRELRVRGVICTFDLFIFQERS